MANYIIIGGTGFIGSNFIKYLAKKNKEIILFHRKSSNFKNLKNIKIKKVCIDFYNIKDLNKKFKENIKNNSIIYNFASPSTNFDKDKAQREYINIQFVKEICNILLNYKKIKLVHISSSTAVGYPNNVIADETFKFNANYDHSAYTKKLGEEVVIDASEKGLNSIIAIPCSTMGPIGIKENQLDMIKQIKNKKLRYCPPGGLCLTYIEDLLHGLYLCGIKKNTKCNRFILGGTNIRYKDYFNEIASFVKGESPKFLIPKFLLPFLCSILALISKIKNNAININWNTGIMLSKNLFYSSNLAMNELGYKITDWKTIIHKTIYELTEKGLI